MNRNTRKPRKEKTKQQETIKKSEGVEITKMNDKELSKQIKDLGAQVIDLLIKKKVQNVIALQSLTEILAFIIINQFSGEEGREEIMKFIIELLRTRLEEAPKKSK